MYEHHIDTVDALHSLHITLHRTDISEAERVATAREQVTRAIAEDDEWMAENGYVHDDAA